MATLSMGSAGWKSPHDFPPRKVLEWGRTISTYASNVRVWVAVLIAVAMWVFPIDFSGQKAAVRLIFA